MKRILKYLILKLIHIVEKIEYQNLRFPNKIIETIDISDEPILVETDTGYQKITHLHKTCPFQVYRITTLNNGILEAADKHIIYGRGMCKKFIKQLSVGDAILTRNGYDIVTKIEKLGASLSMFDCTINDNNHRFYTNNILSHNTTMSSIFITWFSLFNHTKNTLLLSNKKDSMVEIMDRIKELYLHLPNFLKCGIKKWGEYGIRFENKCRIFGQATTKNAGIGFTIHLLYIDEFANIPANIIEPFYENVLPVLSADVQNARFIITSTANGLNLFHDIYSKAVAGVNSFYPVRVDWWEVEGRDEEWKLKEIQNSSEEAFNRQYGNQFVSQSTLLFGNNIQRFWRSTVKTFIVKEELEDMVNLDEKDYTKFFWNPDFDLNELKKGYFVLSIDFAEGLGADYTVINIFQLKSVSDCKMRTNRGDKNIDYLRLVQVGYFRDNYTPIPVFSPIFINFVEKCFDHSQIKIIFEINDNRYLPLYVDMIKTDWYYEDILYKSKHSENSKLKKVGLKLNIGNRYSNFSNFKHRIKKTNIVMTDKKGTDELSTFCLSKNGTYQSTSKNDDIAMSAMNAVVFFENIDSDFTYFVEDFLSEDNGILDKKIFESMTRMEIKAQGDQFEAVDLIKYLDF